uniref:Ig-like domain-containing protein n=1 Tax=Periophthalmus magnuspinnatus TaxID=409849 RepID=A0A3B4BG03_9GOBI
QLVLYVRPIPIDSRVLLHLHLFIRVTAGAPVLSPRLPPSFLHSSPLCTVCKPGRKCYVDDKVSRVAWLNRSNIIFAGQDKWSLDPRVDLVTKGQLEYSLRIQKVDVYDEGSYTCSIQTKQKPKTSHVYLIVQVPASIYKVSEDVIVNEGSNVTLSCLASGRPDPIITWRLLNPSVEFISLDSEKSKKEALQ